MQEEREQELVKLEATLAIEGGYSNLVHFINRLEQSQLFWIIDSLNVSGSVSRELRLNLQMETYFRALLEAESICGLAHKNAGS